MTTVCAPAGTSAIVYTPVDEVVAVLLPTVTTAPEMIAFVAALRTVPVIVPVVIGVVPVTGHASETREP